MAGPTGFSACSIYFLLWEAHNLTHRVAIGLQGAQPGCEVTHQKHQKMPAKMVTQDGHPGNEIQCKTICKKAGMVQGWSDWPGSRLTLLPRPYYNLVTVIDLSCCWAEYVGLDLACQLPQSHEGSLYYAHVTGLTLTWTKKSLQLPWYCWILFDQWWYFPKEIFVVWQLVRPPSLTHPCMGF